MSNNAPFLVTDGVYIGVDRILEFDITDPSDVPVNVQGWNMQFVLKRNAGDTTAVLEKDSSGTDVRIQNAAGGIVYVQLHAADTVDSNGNVLIAPGYYVYSLKRTDLGSSDVLAEGDFTLLEAASR